MGKAQGGGDGSGFSPDESDERSRAAHRAVVNKFGSALANKATSALRLALAFGTEGGLESTGLVHSGVTIDFDADRESDWGPVDGAMSRLERQKRARSARRDFEEEISDIKEVLENVFERHDSRHVVSEHAMGLQLAEDSDDAASAILSCWSNRTLRIPEAHLVLSEFADDERIKYFDLPEPLELEVHATSAVVGARSFRKGHGLSGSNITVAVIDSEVDRSHKAFGRRVRRGKNYSKEAWGTPHHHGTAVAGIIGANVQTLTGIAPDVEMINYKLFTGSDLQPTDHDAAAALEQALLDGADIANCSWGLRRAGKGRGRLARACNVIWRNGLVIVKSAGNGGPHKSTLTAPADASGIIVVGATDRTGSFVPDYSARGPAGTKAHPHFVAPGGTDAAGITSCLPGGGIGDAGCGTSYSAAHASGLAALLLEKNRHHSPDDIRRVLVSSSKPLANTPPHAQGAGLVKL